MKLLIVGSRSIERFDLSEYVPPETELIISGGAKGMDRIAEKYADEHRISKLILLPKYERYGKAAPIKRNEQMVEIADMVLVVWDGSSKGTRATAEYAKKKNKPLTLLVVSPTEKA
ncbi:MAG: hypothetical protein J6Q82_06180 [Clostridia bacterium]|nr:hypothetical protein [Clostridia bacterium]